MSLRAPYLLLVLSLLAAALFLRLGFWQLSRLEERRQENRRAEDARAAEVLDLNRPDRAGTSRAHRRVVATGEYDRTHEIVLRGHMYRETPGVHLVTPLRLRGSDSAVLVNRGYLPSPDATFAVTDGLDEPGTVRVEGVALSVPLSADSGGLLTSNGRETWRRLDLAALRRRLPYPLLDVYILQRPDDSLPRSPRRLEPQPLDDGPHLSYAIQWFAFAAIAIGGGLIVVVKRS